MDGRSDASVSETAGTRVSQEGDQDLVVTRTFNAPARIVFEAWTTPALFKHWWAPRSVGVPLRSCEMDVRIGGRYRLEFGHDTAQAMAFFGRYIEVTRPSRLAWTNEEGGEGAVTTMIFEQADGRTRLTLRERYPSKEERDEAIAGMADCMPEQFAQLDEVLSTLSTSVDRS